MYLPVGSVLALTGDARYAWTHGIAGRFEDAVEGGEGTPSPMLAVTGLSLKDLQAHIAKTNKHLPDNSKIGISLYNGPKAFVVTGPSRALYGLVTHLRKVRAPSGLDQSKIPFSQRKPVFSVRFLVIGFPYHSKYLENVADEVMEDLESKELWTKEDLAIPVYHTENGELGTPSLCKTVLIVWVRLRPSLSVWLFDSLFVRADLHSAHSLV